MAGKEIMLYATDFEYCPYSFKRSNVNHFLVECNYIKDMVDIGAENKEHILRGHAELKTSINMIESNKTDKMKNVIFCHLSEKNCDSDIVKNETKKYVDCNIYIAKKGKTIVLSDKESEDF